MKNININTNLISCYLKENNLSVKEFCKLCKISISTYYNIINGKNFFLSALFKMAKVLNVHICKMFLN